jgi:hypothetical protein
MPRAAKPVPKISVLTARPSRWAGVLTAVVFSGLYSTWSIATDLNAQDRPALSPPVNHEAGRIESVITATDDGYRFRGYVLSWRSMRIVVADSLDRSRVPGDNLDIVVYRTEANGHRVLRFESNSGIPSEDEAEHESSSSSAAITLGTAQIEETVAAESDGYRFVGYFVTWHNQRVFVVDPQSAPARSTGETINFRVLRTGLGASQRLSFTL